MAEGKDDDRRGMLIAGVIVTGIGVLFLLIELRIIPRIGDMWPVIPIIVGIALIVGGLTRNGRRGESEESGRRSTAPEEPARRPGGLEEPAGGTDAPEEPGRRPSTRDESGRRR